MIEVFFSCLSRDIYGPLQYALPFWPHLQVPHKIIFWLTVLGVVTACQKYAKPIFVYPDVKLSVSVSASCTFGLGLNIYVTPLLGHSSSTPTRSATLHFFWFLPLKAQEVSCGPVGKTGSLLSLPAVACVGRDCSCWHSVLYHGCLAGMGQHAVFWGTAEMSPLLLNHLFSAQKSMWHICHRRKLSWAVS